MADQSGHSHFQALFESALWAYERNAGVKLAQHPLAAQLQHCHTVEDVTVLLQAKAQPFGGCRASHKIMKSIKTTVSTLTPLTLSAAATLADAVGPVRPNAPMACFTSLTTVFRHYYHLRRPYTLVLVSYLTYVPFFSPYVDIVLTSN
jgi:hypothetical protein